MKILVIKSSPHKESSSGMLADEFINGLKENNHSVEIFDAGHKKIGQCIACDVCRTKGECFNKDAMVELKDLIFKSDMIVFVTPLYYFGFSAQLKTVIDRFYDFNDKLTRKHIKSFLICAGYDSSEESYKALVENYNIIADFLNFDNKGMLLGRGCGTPSMTKSSPFMKEAYDMGKRIN